MQSQQQKEELCQTRAMRPYRDVVGVSMWDAALLRLTPVYNRADALGPCSYSRIQSFLLIEVARTKLLVVEVKHLQ